MRRTANLASLVCILCLVSGGGALAQSAAGADSAQQTTGSATAKTPVSAATRTYVEQAAMGDRFEIESSRIALRKSQSADVRNFAKQMIHDHGQSTSTLKKLLATDHLDVAPPAKLDPEHAKMLSDLRAATGTSFDQLYAKMQLDGHRQALQLHQGYAAAGDNDDLKKFAADVSKVVEMHLAHVSELVKKLDMGNAG